MSIEIPYSELDLKIALIGLGVKDDNEMEELCAKTYENFEAKYKSVIQSKAELNRQVAEINGITLTELIDSPNYELLINEYKKTIINSFADTLIEEGLTPKEAWALVSIGLGVIDI